MKKYKEKNSRQWRSQTWKREIAAIKGEGTPKVIRDSAFISLRKRVQGYYKQIARRYARLLSLEGEQVNEFLDYILYKCILQYAEARGTFFGYFTTAVTNSIRMIKRYRKRRMDRGFELQSLDYLLLSIEKGRLTPKDARIKDALVDTREVDHEAYIVDQIKEMLSPIQRKVLDYRRKGYSEYEIGQKTFMNWLQVKRSLKNIQIATEVATEV